VQRQVAGHNPRVARVVIDEGPIPLAEIERYDDPDIETQLEREGYIPETTTYRLIELDTADFEDSRWFPGPRQWGAQMVEALARGDSLPPVVVVETDRGRGYGLIDGLNRLHAYWAVGRSTIRAYELITG
jgi:hypothetical protein